MDDTQRKLMAAKLVALEPRLRLLLGKEATLVGEGNVYGERIPQDAFNKLVDQVLSDEITRKLLLAALEETPRSVDELAVTTGLEPAAVFRAIPELQRKGQVVIDQTVEGSPRYRAQVQQ